jgi:hypothetical protein
VLELSITAKFSVFFAAAADSTRYEKEKLKSRITK